MPTPSHPHEKSVNAKDVVQWCTHYKNNPITDQASARMVWDVATAAIRLEIDNLDAMKNRDKLMRRPRRVSERF
ncbi:hypothetical protein PRIPAC_91037 [Pristionchus pacificus]|uniref:Uncharacterized protein n=1 Tax=Pristionchus pacificus TaxID=54126 RepID=A0A2A6B3M2_PRIPA|nr:hypothetical protein PRIPAC_91037 [Pristionchus pacificus]|eukprot:PDM60485.1 hypothetical protein PRIPAC_53463 [Pristionchus pacificus]